MTAEHHRHFREDPLYAVLAETQEKVIDLIAELKEKITNKKEEYYFVEQNINCFAYRYLMGAIQALTYYTQNDKTFSDFVLSPNAFARLKKDKDAFAHRKAKLEEYRVCPKSIEKSIQNDPLEEIIRVLTYWKDKTAILNLFLTDQKTRFEGK